MKVLVIIPAHNEEANIASTVENLQKQCPQHDYIVVNEELEAAVRDMKRILGGKQHD